MTCPSLAGLLVGVFLTSVTLAGREDSSRRAPPIAIGNGAGQSHWVYLGTYTGDTSQGIYCCRLDPMTGALSGPELAVATPNPSYLAVHPNHRFLYAVNELSTFKGEPAGAVSAFAINRQTGRLRLLNERTSGGPGPCYLVVDARGKAVLVANYNGGSIEVLPVQGDGKLGEPTAFIQHTGSSVNPARQRGPHAHGIALDRMDRFAFVCDLGLDKVMIYRFDADRGTLVPSRPPWASVAPGAGPRHIALVGHDRFAYVIDEIGSTVTAFACDPARGRLRAIQTVATLSGPCPGNLGAEIVPAPTGRFLYASNRGDDSIVIFAINPRDGRLTCAQRVSSLGRTPRGFAIDPTGRWLVVANQDSGSVVVFRVDPKTGWLTPTDHAVRLGNPVNVTVLAD